MPDYSGPAFTDAEPVDGATPATLLNACALACPMPLLKTKQALSALSPGQMLQVIASDPGSWRDITSFTEQSTHELVKREQRDDAYFFWIRKAEGPRP